MMVRNRRLSKVDRKKEIMQAAARSFIDKGFAKTSMEDVVAGTSLSKGGVYHYYQNTIDILHDLMLAGNHYRLEIIRQAIDSYSDGDDLAFLAKAIVDKILDQNEFMPIYITFLLESHANSKLKDLYEQIRQEFSQEYYKLTSHIPKQLIDAATSDFIMHFVNSLIIGGGVLEARECFLSNREILTEMVKLYLEQNLNNSRKEGR